MKKLDKVTYDEKMYDLNNTKYDYLFREIIKSRGKNYYSIDRVKAIHKSNNKVSGLVEGTKEYKVSIDFDNDNIVDVSCECEYHKSTDKYCKHVYALLMSLKMIYEKERMLVEYKKNIERIKEIVELIKNTYYENKKYLNVLMFTVTFKDDKKYLNYIKKLEDFIDEKNIYKLRSALRYSCDYLNYTIDDYNELLDKIEEGKNVIEERKRKKAEEKLKPKEEYEDEGYTYVFDDSFIYDKFDKISNEINELEKNLKELEKAKKENEKKIKKTLFFGFLYKLFNNSKSKNDTTLMSWEEDLVKKGEYEPFHFEEENMEEDDYYYEDD